MIVTFGIGSVAQIVPPPVTIATGNGLVVMLAEPLIVAGQVVASEALTIVYAPSIPPEIVNGDVARLTVVFELPSL